MTSYYSVIKYVPDPIADESINVGVIAFSGSNVKLHISSNLGRAQAFAKKNSNTLIKALSDIQKMLLAGHLSESSIQRLSESWINQVQFTQPRFSSKSVDELLVDITSMFLLSEDVEIINRRPGKRSAVKLAVDSITSQLRLRFKTSKSEARKLIRLDYPAVGKLESHDLDLAIVNGVLRTGAVAINFNQENKSQLRRDIDATAFALEDMRKINKRTPFFVIGFSQVDDQSEMSRAIALFNNWKISIVTENKIPIWSEQLVRDLPNNMLHV